MICDQLSLKSVSLFKLKSVHNFNDQLFKLKITHVIYSDLFMKKKHWENTVSMLITDLRQHDIILRKSWMNWNQLLLNMIDDSIVFRENLSSLIKKTVAESVEYLSFFKHFTSLSPCLITLKILPQSAFTADNNLFQMCSVRAAPYTVLTH